MVATEKPMPTMLLPGHRGDAASKTMADVPSCVFCGRSMAAPATVAGVPIHPDCFTRMCVAALVEGTPEWRWIPYLRWVFR